MLLASSSSPGIRSGPSTSATTWCEPAVADHVADPLGPPLAVSVTDAPGASGVVWVSDQVRVNPPSWNPAPRITPAGVAAVPWLRTTAENRTGEPAIGDVGDHDTSVTTTSGAPLGVQGTTTSAYDPSEP